MSAGRPAGARRVALATYAGLPALAADDRPLLALLPRHGVTAEPVVWDAAGVAWARYDAVVVRSCWDYHLRPGAFLDWVAAVERAGVPLCNPPSALRWNADKRYLRALADAGVPTVPTRWIEPGDAASPGGTLARLLEETGWDEVVVKPTVSASAHGTWRTSRARAGTDGARFRALAAGGPLMLQPFVAAVTTAGEWSLVFLGGRYSHAVLKRPRPGDFRVQHEHGGRAEPAAPDAATVAAAARALSHVPGGCLYARVDGCVVDGVFQLMELEVLEPSLFLATSPGAAERFAEAIVAALSAGGAP